MLTVTQNTIIEQADYISDRHEFEAGDLLLWQNPDGTWRVVRIGRIDRYESDSDYDQHRIDYLTRSGKWESVSGSTRWLRWELGRMNQQWAGRLVFEKYELAYAHLNIEGALS